MRKSPGYKKRKAFREWKQISLGEVARHEELKRPSYEAYERLIRMMENPTCASITVLPRRYR
jgi:hypothetical protein